MIVEKMYVLLILGVYLVVKRIDGEKLCSCYSFNNETDGMAWTQAMDSCKYNSKTLVVMETEREWEFITNEIQNRVGSTLGEWLIGLERNITTGKWTWINGKPLTINKWKSFDPDASDFYGMIHKKFPSGSKGSLSSIKGSLQRGWICEEETDDCLGDCFFRAVPTSTSPPGTKAVSTRRKTSTERYITDESGSSTNVFTPTTAKSTDEVLADDNTSSSPTVMIAAASLSAVLFVALIILIAVPLLRRKKRQGEDAEGAKPKKSEPRNDENQLGESQDESINPVEVAKLLGSPNSTSDEINTRFDPPPENCEYAVVDKAKKKQKEEDFVYAQLADFDNETDPAKPPKPPCYEPTVYADVEELPPELPGRKDPDSSQPTYANLKKTGVETN